MYAAGDSGEAIFMVQPEEMACYKSLRRLVDKVFTADDRFLVSSVAYAEMDTAEDGVNKHMRSLLFIPSKQSRRGVKRMGDADNRSKENNLPAAKEAQRQSKQKERCENRLMSLLFATVYDPATKRCRLVQGVPPLKLIRKDKNGQARIVSNFTDVRLYLRNSMASVLSAYSESVKVLSHLLPHTFGVLPVLFTIVGRTLMATIRIDDPGEERDKETVRRRANDSLEYCMKSIQHFITTWERRNFSTDNPLLHCLKAGVNSDSYKAVHELLRAMISLLPPTGREPYDDQFRRHSIYFYALPSGLRCEKKGDKQCFLGQFCDGASPRAASRPDMSEYLHYIDALTKCARVPPRVTFDLVDAKFTENEFTLSMWKFCEGLGMLHRMESASTDMRRQRQQSWKKRDLKAPSYVEGIHYEVAKCWSALGRSNVRAWHLLDDLNITDTDMLKETAIELIFGGAIASIALFEREGDILPICANLRSKKGPMVVRESHDVSDNEISPGKAPHYGADNSTSMKAKGKLVMGESIPGPRKKVDNGITREARENQQQDEILDVSQQPSDARKDVALGAGNPSNRCTVSAASKPASDENVHSSNNVCRMKTIDEREAVGINAGESKKRRGSVLRLEPTNASLSGPKSKSRRVRNRKM